MRHFMFALVVGAVSIASVPSLAFAQHGHGHGSYGQGGHTYGNGSYGHGGHSYGYGYYGPGRGLYGLDVHLGPSYLYGGSSHGHYHGGVSGVYYYPPAPIYYNTPPVCYYPANPPAVVIPTYPSTLPPQGVPLPQGGSVPIPAPQSGNGNGPIAPAAGKTLPYGGQKTCPVTGEELGSHGTAIPVAVQGQTIYVCCESCVNAVRRNPGQYLPKVEAERKGVAR